MTLPVQSCGYVIPFRTVHTTTMAIKLRMHVGRHCFHTCGGTRDASLESYLALCKFPRPQCRAGVAAAADGGAQLRTALPRVVDPRVAAPGPGGAGRQRRKYASERGRCLQLNRLLPPAGQKPQQEGPRHIPGEPTLRVPRAEKQAWHLWFYDYPL